MKRLPRLEHWQIIAVCLIGYDALAVNIAYLAGLLLRFDLRYSQIPAEYLQSYLNFAPIYTVVCILVFWGLRLYNSIWRFAGFSDLNRVMGASVITSLVQIAGTVLAAGRMPASYYIIGALTQGFLLLAARFGYRYVLLERSRRKKSQKNSRRAMVIGAGAAGQAVIRELKTSLEIMANACCIIDDNPNKWGRFIEDIPVVGGRDAILENVRKYGADMILLAIPSAPAQVRREILNICKDSGCELRSLPGIYQLANGDVLLRQMKPLRVDELLGREIINVSMEEIYRDLRGKTILVTGGGGSIGSELSRQIASHGPRQLILFDIYENNVYDIQQELRHRFPDLELTVLIGSVRDSQRINWVFETYKPDIVYHAAAHKHVPLMEGSPNEAIKNNVIGTYKTACAAMKHGTRRFVLLSTDKAVNPTNIMGASKRICEMVVQAMDEISREAAWDRLPRLSLHEQDLKQQLWDRDCRTEFVAVRFGNVLGSSGSVIPLFRRQIAEGGPVTVTHPEIIRYFMTIPEAVSLVLQAGTYARGGEIFVLDMGEPVKIDDLARNMIRLSGFEPDEEIKIVYTGLRPGEKLYEEKLMAEEGLEKTANELIHIGRPVPFDKDVFLTQLEALARASYGNSGDIHKLVAEIVTTYRPAGSEDTVR